VTVRYATGHTKLVPLECQNTHLRPADEPPAEPMPMEHTICNFVMPSLLGNDPPAFNFGCNQAASKADTQPGSQYSVGQEVKVYSESSQTWMQAEVTFIAPNGCVTVDYGGNRKTLEPERHHLLKPSGSGAGPAIGSFNFACNPAASPAGSQTGTYSAGQQVNVYSETNKTWVQAKVTFVAPNGCVTVQYTVGGNQKTLEPERHHLLSPSGSGSDPAVGQRPAFGGCGGFAPQQSSHADCGIAPPEQAGTFAFDLSQLCNDAGMPGTGNVPASCNAPAQPAPVQYAPAAMPGMAKAPVSYNAPAQYAPVAMSGLANAAVSYHAPSQPAALPGTVNVPVTGNAPAQHAAVKYLSAATPGTVNLPAKYLPAATPGAVNLPVSCNAPAHHSSVKYSPAATPGVASVPLSCHAPDQHAPVTYLPIQYVQ